MEAKAVSAAVFAAAFIAAYLFICFAVPGMRLRLAAEPSVYFLRSLIQMVPLKAAISFAVALPCGALPLLFTRRTVR